MSTEATGTPEGIQILGDFSAGPFDSSFEIEREESDLEKTQTFEVETQEDENGDSSPADETQGTIEAGTTVTVEQDDEDYSGYSDAQILALSYIKEGVLPEDTDVSKMDALSLKEALLENVMSTAESRAEEKLKQLYPSERDLERAKLIFNGATDEEAQYIDTLDQLASLDVEDDTEDGDVIRKHLIVQHYIAKGFDKDKAEKFANTHFEDGEDIEEARAAVQYFSSESRARKQELEEKAEAERQAKIKQQEDFRNEVKEKINSGEFGGVKLTQKEQKKMYDSLFEATEELETPDGKVHKVSAYQKKMYEIQNDVEKQLLLAKLVLFDDLNVDKIKTQAKSSSNKDLAELLDSHRTVRAGSGGTNSTQSTQRKIEPLITVSTKGR